MIVIIHPHFGVASFMLERKVFVTMASSLMLLMLLLEWSSSSSISNPIYIGHILRKYSNHNKRKTVNLPPYTTKKHISFISITRYCRLKYKYITQSLLHQTNYVFDFMMCLFVCLLWKVAQRRR